MTKAKAGILTGGFFTDALKKLFKELAEATCKKQQLIATLRTVLLEICAQLNLNMSL